MSFTDDDVKRLKDYLCVLDPLGRYPSDNLKALIARLEAAEILLERLTNPEEGYELSDVDKDHDFYVAWRKACGRDK